MADTMGGRPLIITTDRGDYYVIPRAALDQFRATPEQRALIDEQAGQHTEGSFASPTGTQAAAEPSFDSDDEVTVLAWFQDKGA